MYHYTDLAFRYIKMKKRRSLITILGVTISVMFLYMLLNLSMSYLLNYRTYLRDKFDYEMVFFTENEQQINAILNDSSVKDGTVSDYYKYSYYGSTNYDNALYINTTNPYRMNNIFEDIKAKYGVDGKLHKEMAATYLQGDEGNTTYVMILIALLISYIIAIFGVGLIRNSIQLNMLERIKDFGQLRCIGSTRKQTRMIIYLQGLILELAGIFLGTVCGVIGSLIVGAIVSWKHTGFHLIPLVFILIAFLSDLYFAMDENAKLVSEMTPVSAISGEYRIKKEKLKRRKSGLYGKMFGLSGDYAYKNIKRNPGRFRRTITAMALGIAASIVIFGILSTISKYQKFQEEDNGYYNVYYEHTLMPWETQSELMNSLPEYEVMNQVSEIPGMEKSKRIYTAFLPTMDWEKYVADRYLPEYMEWSDSSFIPENYDENNAPEEFKDYRSLQKMETSSIAVCGYDEEDMARYADTLTDGRLPEKDNEMLMVISNYMYLYDERVNNYHEKIQRYLDYKVGDTIDIVNPIHFRELLQKKMVPVTKAYEEESKKLEEQSDEAEKKNDMDEWKRLAKKIDELDRQYYINIDNIKGSCYQKMIEDNDCVTYTICGIVEGDANQGRRLSSDMMIKTETWCEPIITIVSKNQYMKMLGVDENWVSGVQYHFDDLNVRRYYDIDPEGGIVDSIYSPYDFSAVEEKPTFIRSPYPLWTELLNNIEKVIFGAGVIVLFIVVMSVVNTINATASSLYMRKKELAQLRVLGASKKDIFKMIMFEGVLESIISCVLGTIMGTVLSFLLFHEVFAYIVNMQYVFPWTAFILSIVVVSLVLCGVVYVPLKQMPMDAASDLATAGE